MSDRCGLSILAMFDDIARNRAILTAGLEAEFASFASTQEDCRKKWRDAEAAVQEMAGRVQTLEKEKKLLENQLKHARSQIDVEISKRKHAEEERNEFEKQILMVRELLHDKNNTTVLNDQAREQLAFLSTDFRSLIYETSARSRNTNVADDSDSILADDIYDHTEEDLDSPVQRKSKKRPSAPPCEEQENFNPNQNIAVEKSSKRHRRSKSADLVAAGMGNMVAYDSTSGKRKSTAAMTRSTSQGIQPDAVSIGSNGWSPEMKRYNSGNSMTRPHCFENHSVLRHEMCFVCNKKLKLFATHRKCKDCSGTYHIECKDLAPLPCMAISSTPKIIRSTGTIKDYAPSIPPYVPSIIILLIQEIESRGLKEVGLYRISGSDREVKELKERILKGKVQNFNAISDIHVICSCLKDFLRNLKEPLVTFKLYDAFVKAADKRDHQESVTDLYQVISELPLPNRDTLAYMMLHLQKVSECKECNMSVSNLVRVFAPTIIGHSSENPSNQQLVMESGKQQLVLTRLMELSTDYWSTFIRPSQESLLLSTPTPDKFRIFPKYDFSSSSKRMSRPLSSVNTPGAYETGGIFSSNIIGGGTYTGGAGAYTKKTTNYFEPLNLK